MPAALQWKVAITIEPNIDMKLASETKLKQEQLALVIKMKKIKIKLKSLYLQISKISKTDYSQVF